MFYWLPFYCLCCVGVDSFRPLLFLLLLSLVSFRPFLPSASVLCCFGLFSFLFLFCLSPFHLSNCISFVSFSSAHLYFCPSFSSLLLYLYLFCVFVFSSSFYFCHMSHLPLYLFSHCPFLLYFCFLVLSSLLLSLLSLHSLLVSPLLLYCSVLFSSFLMSCASSSSPPIPSFLAHVVVFVDYILRRSCPKNAEC